MRTSISDEGGKTPKWNVMMDVKINDIDCEATLQCWDSDSNKDELIGEAKFKVSTFITAGGQFKVGQHEERVELHFKGSSVGHIFFKSTFTQDNLSQVVYDLQQKIELKKHKIAA